MSASHRWAMLILLGVAAGCPATDDVDPVETSETGDQEMYECDPVGADPQVGELLNAPLADDVEVIIKEPQHPGNPGPGNLP
ncbi:MAG: hypothetical protein AAGA48_36835 [Myxococcota bacterium]